MFILTSFLFFILFLIPYILLHRMYMRWKNNSLYYYERKLNNIEDKKERIIERIREINNDKIRKNNIDIIIAITTIALNTSSIAAFILDYF